MVSELVRDAYEDGFDYFFQVNDDTVFKTKGASSGGHEGLKSTEVYRGGAVG